MIGSLSVAAQAPASSPVRVDVADLLALRQSASVLSLRSVARRSVQSGSRRSAFRARGIAARYVSGYIETDPPPGEPPRFEFSPGLHAASSLLSANTAGCASVRVEGDCIASPQRKHGLAHSLQGPVACTCRPVGDGYPFSQSAREER